MVRGLCRPALWAAIVLGATGSTGRAQGPDPGCAVAPYGPGGPSHPARRGIGPRAWWGTGGGPSYSPGGTGPGFVPGLPRGRRYYGGRYFGSFNNRFYSPQYGYF
jgi:hypothetical protein